VHEQLHARKDALHQLAEDGNLNGAQLQEAVSAAGQTMGDAAVHISGQIAQAKAILTEDQVAVLQTMHQKMKDRRTGLHGKIAGHLSRLGRSMRGHGSHPGHGPRGMMPGGPDGLPLLAKAGEDIGLTQDQKDQIHAILKNLHAEKGDMHKTIRAQGEALHDAVLAGAPDEAAIRAAAQNLANALGQAAAQTAPYFKQVHEILTEDQIAKIKSFRLAHCEAHDGRNPRGERIHKIIDELLAD